MNSKRTHRPFGLLLSGLTILGLISVNPESVPPAAAAGLLLFSFGLIITGLRRAGSRNDSVSA
jgi:hypothetical protein